MDFQHSKDWQIKVNIYPVNAIARWRRFGQNDPKGPSTTHLTLIPAPMESIGTIHLSFQAGLQFQVDFGPGEGPFITTDAPPPLGSGRGPDSERLLMAAVANCLSASLVFALRKFRNPDAPVHTRVQGWLERNDQGRLRMHSIAVDIHLGVPASSLRLVERAIDQFEDFCVVTQSVRAAFPVVTRVFDSEGVLLTGTESSV